MLEMGKGLIQVIAKSVAVILRTQGEIHLTVIDTPKGPKYRLYLPKLGRTLFNSEYSDVFALALALLEKDGSPFLGPRAPLSALLANAWVMGKINDRDWGDVSGRFNLSKEDMAFIASARRVIEEVRKLHPDNDSDPGVDTESPSRSDGGVRGGSTEPRARVLPLRSSVPGTVIWLIYRSLFQVGYT
jgi:hypothetical protein